jgi:ssDNA-binding Zn-finger/Zn-ribbon topoisomerase 1
MTKCQLCGAENTQLFQFTDPKLGDIFICNNFKECDKRAIEKLQKEALEKM